MHPVFITILFFLHFLQLIQAAIPTPNQQFRNNNSATTQQPSKPTYNIGVIFPNVTAVKYSDPSLANMIVSSEVAIKLAADSIAKSNWLPDVQLNFTRYYSDEANPGRTSWAAVNMVENRVDAVIGDMLSSMTEASASITSIWQIPQCSSASASYSLTDKSIYPYFFRTVASVMLYGESLVDWVDSMGWGMFALIYTNDAVGQQVLHAMLDQAKKHKITAMAQIPLYSLSEDQIEESLLTLEASGSRVVVLADSNTSDQLAILSKAMSMGLLTQGWVWILTNDVSPVLYEITNSTEELAMYDGLMFISGLWDLTGEPKYDNLNQIWKSQRVPEDFNDPKEWNTTGLSYNAPQSYACAELLALGLSHALDTYPGGRAAGLSALGSGHFNSSRMIPSFYNLNYTGPSGYMGFSESGDLQSGYFQISYMLKGGSVPYARIKLNKLEFIPHTEIIYLGHTTEKPLDMIPRQALNPTIKQASGVIVIIICVLAFTFIKTMFVLIFLFRDLKPIMVSSPVFCFLQLIGIELSYISVLLYLEKPNIAKCITRQIIMIIGFALVIGSIIAKNYRIYRIFQNVFTIRTSRLKSNYLVRIVAAFAIIGLVPLIVWYATFPMQINDEIISSSTYCWLCTYPTAAKGNWGHINISELIVLIWCAVLTGTSAFLAFKTRNVNSKWSETSQIAYVSYNAGLAAIIATPSFFMPTEYFQIAIYLKISSILFASTFTLVVLFLPKFLLIIRHIAKSNKKLSLYRMNTDSQAQLTQPTNSTTMDENLNLKLVAKNMFDFTVQAHEGILPVKKLARFEFFSIWGLKHVVLVPLRRFFILSDKSGRKASLYNYVSCEMMPPKNKSHHIFRVRTDEGLVFMFQVSDQIALERWINWFQGIGATPSRSATPGRKQFEEKKASSISTDEVSTNSGSQSQFPPERNLQAATFGNAPGDSVSALVGDSSIYINTSSFYTPTSASVTQHQLDDIDNSRSALYNHPSQLSSMSMLESEVHCHSTNGGSHAPMAGTSFGVVDSCWQRYP